ncbi:bifunctional adenosylcobinamide kinase/adenosylcobinamide-phosphate guanylyltransferase [Microbispora bryophytorum]|uniref:Adenosylcobinamide kinase n=1 Tax=Microbispora bryophytorum subsp. camponoti TaxID=1677852 RepID=A0ABR8L299_9ACTN|nr:bifunctional adenosylcobinamide kinase/adenosylcobinamide-phosphate guanylyltransferase [Microbispora camponoti]MBD3142628.1 bifunctional adenosylcobinamide kinase/adenosylcobinamide-phosphate guanylyltransferase [Microbispora camponoti]
MEIRLEGTGGPEGWPVPGCPCASCGRLAPGHRRPASIVLDGRVRLTDAHPPAGYVIRRTADGCEVTGPGGDRLLYAVGPATGSPARDADAPFDVVLMDLPDRPERLGDLRRRGRVTPATPIIAVHLGHRIPAESELARRLGFWGATAVPDGTVVDTASVRAAGVEAASVQAAPWVRPRRTLLLGGSRSGKSEEAELRLAAEPEVTYVATGPSDGDDPAWLARVRAHRERRPAHWRTVETTDLASVLSGGPGTSLIDGIGTWLAAVFDECAAWPDGTPAAGHRAALDRVAERCDALTASWRGTRARVVAVTDEVGLGVIPATPAGRLFRDALGRLNQALARESEDVALVVSGRVVPLPL